MFTQPATIRPSLAITTHNYTFVDECCRLNNPHKRLYSVNNYGSNNDGGNNDDEQLNSDEALTIIYHKALAYNDQVYTAPT